MFWRGAGTERFLHIWELNGFAALLVVLLEVCFMSLNAL